MKIDESASREIRIQLLVSSGFSRNQATIADDLGQHAAAQAIETLIRICESAPDERTSVVSRVTAMRFLNAAVEFALKDIIEVITNGQNGQAQN